jgi:hypothetical protein
MHKRSMQQLYTICNTVLDVQKRGARLIVRDDYTLILLDYDGLDSRQTMLIAEQFPDVTVSVHESNASHSGYCVLFTRQAKKIWYKHRHFMQFTGTIVVVLCLLSVFNINTMSHISTMCPWSVFGV